MKALLFRLSLLVFLMTLLFSFAQVTTVEEVASGVYFHEGDRSQGHCNNGWVILEDYVVVIDANFPSGAMEVMPKIRSLTDKPIRFVFDTHHHGDHAYGNQVWADNGAIPVGHTGVIEEMRKYETGYFGSSPGRWEDAAENRPDVAESRLKLPSLLFDEDLFFDDGEKRVELLHFGVAHTHGDGFAWLPNERILFTGDAAVNGPYNYVGDGNVTEWIETLAKAIELKPRIVCPGHGPSGGPEILSDQRDFFMALRSEVKRLFDDGLDSGAVQKSVDSIRATLTGQENIAGYVGSGLAAQVEKVYVELGGQPFETGETEEARRLHARAHGHSHQ